MNKTIKAFALTAGLISFPRKGSAALTTGNLSYTGSLQIYTVPVSGIYKLTLAGASGGIGGVTSGGIGNGGNVSGAAGSGAVAEPPFSLLN